MKSILSQLKEEYQPFETIDINDVVYTAYPIFIKHKGLNRHNIQVVEREINGKTVLIHQNSPSNNAGKDKTGTYGIFYEIIKKS